VDALRDEGPDGDRLRHLLAKPLESDAEVAEALELLGRSPGMTRAKEKLREYADIAHAELKALPTGPANDALVKLVQYTIERVG
jgi:heptaprenyl diphosphate synthase